MKLHKEGRKLAKDLLRASFTDGALDEEKVKKATAIVIKAKPRNTIGVLKEFARLVRLEIAKRHAIIESTTELEASEKSAITRALRAKYGGDVSAEYKINTGLLGGLRIQIGSDVLDASVRTRLDRLAVDLAA
jgi:F-type H+-transporting ATPase subunit delta